MSPTIIKAIVGICSVGVIGGAGVAANYFLSSESIRAYIERTKKSINKVFLTSDGLDLNDIKLKYTANTKKTKPNNSKNQAVTADNLVEWCSNNVDSKFSNDEDSLYQNILSWCFVNPKTIAQELESRQRVLIAGESGDEDAWKTAWDNYNRDKSRLGEISDSTAPNLNGNDRNTGGPALQKWCKERKSENKKLYEEDIEKIYGLFETWCAKAKN